MKKIAGVTFDLWDTLIQEYPGGALTVAKARVDGIMRILEKCGIGCSERDVALAYAKSGDFLQMTWSKKRDMPVRDHVLFLLSCIDDKLTSRLRAEDLTDIENVYSSALFQMPPRLLPGAREALKSVKSQGYRIGLISNTGRTPGTTLRAVMEKLGIVDYFDAMTFSNEILVRKPAETAFWTTLEKMMVHPRASVHVGDDPEKDVRGAQAIGMRTIQVVPRGREKCESADSHVRSMHEVSKAIEEL